AAYVHRRQGEERRLVAGHLESAAHRGDERGSDAPVDAKVGLGLVESRLIAPRAEISEPAKGDVFAQRRISLVVAAVVQRLRATAEKSDVGGGGREGRPGAPGAR